MKGKRKHPIVPVEGLQNRIKDCRENAGLSLDRLANILKMTKTAVRNYEIGLAEPGLSTLIKMSEIFGVSIDYLLGINGLEKQTVIKNRNLNELNNFIENIKRYSGNNATSIKRAIAGNISALVTILKANEAAFKTPDRDKNLAEFQDYTEELNAVFEGNSLPYKNKNIYSRLKIENNRQYSILMAVKNVLESTINYQNTLEKQYDDEHTFFTEMQKARDDFRSSIQKLEDEINCIIPKIKKEVE